MTQLMRRTNPVNEILPFYDDMFRLWDDLVTPLWRPRWSLWQWPDWAVGDNLAVDVYETDDSLIVQATLPGVRQEDVEITEQDGWLTIRAQSQQETQYEDRGWVRRERRYGAWQRSLRLPADVKVDKAKATLENGVLSIELPKKQAGKRLVNRIKVTLPKPRLKLPKVGRKEKKVKVKKVA